MSQPTIQALLVEDNLGDERLIREYLKDSTYSKIAISAEGSLADAQKRLVDEVFDIVLLDLSLPDSFGLDTLRQMLGYVEKQPIPIIVLTGLDDAEAGATAVEEGAQDFLPKNEIDGKLLERAINYAIKRHEAEERLRRSEREYRSLIDDVFDTSMVAVLILNKSFEVVWCNEATEIYFRISKERLIGKDKRELIDSDLKCIFADPDEYSAKLLDAYEKQNFTDHFECMVIAEDDRDERWLDHWSQPIREGVFTGGRIEQYMDITGRKKLEFAEREQREFAEALSDIATAISSRLDLDVLLPKILEEVAFIVPHQIASIYLADSVNDGNLSEDFFTFNRATNSRTADPQIKKVVHILFNVMQDTYRPLRIGSLHESLPNDENGWLEKVQVQSYVGAPLLLQNSLIGTISLIDRPPDCFDAEDEERLAAFAELCAIAIQNASLYEQSRELGRVNERQRLARDLHDSVSQTLFSSYTMAEAALRRWEKNPDAAKSLVHDVHQLTLTALGEMRLLLLELRPNDLIQTNIKQLFVQYLEPIQSRRGFELKLDIAEILDLPPEVKLALYRIAQEALNNIFKHAGATQVDVNLVDHSDYILLQVTDDGSGFSFDQIEPTSLGLNIMRERAEEIGADLDITTEGEVGTTVNVVWKYPT